MILFLKGHVKGHMRRIGGRMVLVRPYRRDDGPGQGAGDLFAPRPAPVQPLVAEAVEPPAAQVDPPAGAGRPLCIHCGQPEHVEIAEIWGPREFMLDTCCEAAHADIVQAMNDDPDYATTLMRQLGVEDLTGRDLRRVADTGGQFVLDWHPEVGPIPQAEAKAFVARWHRHNKPPVGDIFRAGVWNGGDLVGVAMVGRPVARKLAEAGDAVEVTRLCIRTDLPRELTWKAASALYRHAAEEAARRGYRKIITYTLRDEESGMSLRYARWKPEAETKGGSWDRPGRPREDKAPTVPKIRWAKKLQPAKPSGLEAFMAGSKVVDAAGKPLRVFHGTSVWEHQGKTLGDFRAFDRLASVNVVGRPPSMDTVGSWFSTLPGGEGGTSASSYAGKGGVVYPAYLSIKNPWRPPGRTSAEAFNAFLAKMHETAGRPMPKSRAGLGDTEALRAWLKSKGYDGIVFGPYGDGGEFGAQQAWVALEPTQIKSAVGNAGTYDPENPDMTKAHVTGHVRGRSFVRPHERQVQHGAPPVMSFRSGATRPADLRGYIEAGVPVGIALGELTPDGPVWGMLVRYARAGGQVFVDTGAFTAFTQGRPVDWPAVLDMQSRLAREVPGGGLHFVAPDLVGDQAGSLALLAQHRDRIAEWRALGHDVLVPIQRGQLRPYEAWQAAVRALGSADFSCAIPSNKVAFDQKDIRDLFGGPVKPARAHLLGVAADQAKLGAMVRDIHALSPRTIITSDANRIRAKVGEGRPITEGQRRMARELGEDVWNGAPGVEEFDETELLAKVAHDTGWLRPDQVRELAAAVGVTAPRAQDAWVAAHNVDGLADLLDEWDPDGRATLHAVRAMFRGVAERAVSSAARSGAIAADELREGAQRDLFGS
ncbi:hypothetical protein UFOVP326_49 [uncultured Caudovirales phage]|uniref:ART-PolyVal-like domain-containing protein n=1 Tax=uncultured Caudovirales phage TaxID=2100421 RepID=A0A6J5LU57_9CAUD|nr:hypothetical protein UFOVP326_49 [uncultured Caudovirales phage]